MLAARVGALHARGGAARRSPPSSVYMRTESPAIATPIFVRITNPDTASSRMPAGTVHRADPRIGPSYSVGSSVVVQLP